MSVSKKKRYTGKCECQRLYGIYGYINRKQIGIDVSILKIIVGLLKRRKI